MLGILKRLFPQEMHRQDDLWRQMQFLQPTSSFENGICLLNSHTSIQKFEKRQDRENTILTGNQKVLYALLKTIK